MADAAPAAARRKCLLLDVDTNPSARLVHDSRLRAHLRPVQRTDRPTARTNSLALLHRHRMRLWRPRLLVGSIPGGQPHGTRPPAGPGLAQSGVSLARTALGQRERAAMDTSLDPRKRASPGSAASQRYGRGTSLR